MRKIAIPNVAHPCFPAQDRDFKQHMGLGPKAKWPADGVLDANGATVTRYVKGDFGAVALWVEARRHIPPSPDRWGQLKASKVKRHRVMCGCPVCGAVMSAGRLQQHCDRVHAGDYPAKPDTTIREGDRVRSFDFPGRTDCYADGFVVSVSDTNYAIDVSEYVLDGETVANPPRTVYPPLNGLQGFFGITRGVVRRA